MGRSIARVATLALAVAPWAATADAAISGGVVEPACAAPGERLTVSATVAHPRGVGAVWAWVNGARVSMARVAGTKQRGVYRAEGVAGARAELAEIAIHAGRSRARVRHLVVAEPPPEGPAVVRLFGIPAGASRPTQVTAAETMSIGVVEGHVAWWPADRKARCALLPAQLRHRVGGYKVWLGDGVRLDGMTTFNLLVEQPERYMFSEAMTYALHRSLGVPAPRAFVVRVHVGDAVGPHLLVEQPNRAFFERLGLSTVNLYKRRSVDAGVVEAFERKRGRRDGRDLLRLAQRLAEPDLDRRWINMVKALDVDETLGFFTVRALVASWDGYTRNYYLHHDRTDTWRFIPWDEDETWGCLPDTDCGVPSYDLPIDGVLVQRHRVRQREAELITRPLFEQPLFRARLEERLRAALVDTFTEERLGPQLDALEAVIGPEMERRARAEGGDPVAARDAVRRDARAMREFIGRRREFLERELRR